MNGFAAFLAIACGFASGFGISESQSSSCPERRRSFLNGALVFLVFALIFGVFACL